MQTKIYSRKQTEDFRRAQKRVHGLIVPADLPDPSLVVLTNGLGDYTVIDPTGREWTLTDTGNQRFDGIIRWVYFPDDDPSAENGAASRTAALAAIARLYRRT